MVGPEGFEPPKLAQLVYSQSPLATWVRTRAYSSKPSGSHFSRGNARAMPSFDVVSELDMQEVRNAVDQTAREISQRFDFKGTDSSVELKEKTIEIHTESEPRLQALRQVLEEKMVKRQVSLKALDYSTVEEATKGTVRQTVTLRMGITDEKARAVGKFIKGLGKKGVQHQIQGEQVRVTGKKRDDLQAVIAALKDEDFDLPLQFTNFRD